MYCILYMNNLAHCFRKWHFWIITRNSLIHKAFELSKRIIRKKSMEKSHETHQTNQPFAHLVRTLLPYTYLTLHH